MNSIDNGIKTVLDIKKIINEEEMYFEVTFVDWYKRKKTKKFMNIKNLEEKRWVE